MSKIPRKSLENPYMIRDNHQKYLNRIKKTLYYGKFPKTDRLSLPVTELAAELFSEVHRGKSLERLHCDNAAAISRNACVSPCSLVLAMLYLERLKVCNPEYLEKTAPSDLFLVSLMVSSKFLFDDGMGDEVYIDEWAASSDLTVKELVKLEKDFLQAIDWKIYVSELNFWKKLNEIEMTLAKRESEYRGFSTYTELELLSRTIDVYNLLHVISTITVILATTYTLGVITIAGSVFLTSHIPGTSLQIERMDTKKQTDLVFCENNASSYADISLQNIENLKTDIENDTEIIERQSRYNTKKIDPLNVLKTGFFLASIAPLGADWCIKTDKVVNKTCDYDVEVQYVDWDWWTVPSMKWLSQISEVVENLTLTPIFHDFIYLEISATNMKTFELEDNMHKATKTRLQDQIESSWHEEWIDSMNTGLIHGNPFVRTLTNYKS